MGFHYLLLLVIAGGCVAPIRYFNLDKDNSLAQESPLILESYISCTGNGKIYSRGFFSGELAFNYMSQNDSSFMQFKDIFGRNTLLMWFTPDNVFALDLIENKQYNHDQILKFFPFLYIIEPKDITQFLWGVNPDEIKTFSKKKNRRNKDLSLQFETGKLNQFPFALVSATFKDLNLNHSIIINIQKREHHNTAVNMDKMWNIIRS